MKEFGLGLTVTTSNSALEKSILLACSEALNSAITRAIPSIRARLSELVADIVYPYGEELAQKLSQGITADFQQVAVKGAGGGGLKGTLTIGLIQAGAGGQSEVQSVIARYNLANAFFDEYNKKNSKNGKNRRNRSLAYDLVIEADRSEALNGVNNIDDDFLARLFDDPSIEAQVAEILEYEITSRLR